jgi:hypothetical protein
LEEGGCGWLDRVDHTVHKLLAALGVISRYSTEDHEATRHLQEGALLLPSVVLRGVGLLLLIPLLEPPDRNCFMRE